MTHHHHAHHRLRRENANLPQADSLPVVLPPEIPVIDIPNPIALAPSHALLPRSTSTCLPNDNSGTCEKPTNISSVPIVLGAVIPITVAAIVLLILHRRHKKKLRLEDINDKHKSLDFGLEVKRQAKKNGGSPASAGIEITDPEKSGRRARGMSMDMSSPYLLPAGLNQSRESFHSLSRSVHDGGDPYRPVNVNQGFDPYARSRGENASIYTKSSVGTDRTNTHLLRDTRAASNASFPSRGDSIALSRSESNSPQDTTPPQIRFPERSLQPSAPSQPTSRSPSPLNPSNTLSPALEQNDRDSYFDHNAKDMRNSNNYLANFIANGDSPAGPSELEQPQAISELAAPSQAQSLPSLPTLPQVSMDEVKIAPPSPPRVNGLPSNPRPPRLQSMEASVHHAHSSSMISDTSNYGDGIKVTPPSPPPMPEIQQPMPHRHSIDAPMLVAHEQPQNASLGVQEPGVDSRRLSMSIRPLPIEDPTDNPEQRANRIRSFYKEYFDDSKPDPVGHYGYDDYMEDYGAEFLSGPVYDTNTRDFIYTNQAPYAEPVTRRAMTPPPRAPPRFRQGPPSRMSNNSNNSSRYIPPRGQSALSAHSTPRKNLPPPSELSSLPTPHMLKDDAMIYNVLDFAPPSTFRDRQAGRRPDSPLGTARPYSPSVRAHVPLESPFQELAPVPSPFQLRKSGTFTALDFAPPPRFKTSDANSDAASIRSNGSGMSQVQLHSLRAGAYRVSRIPKEMVGTRDDIVSALKPKLDMVSPA